MPVEIKKKIFLGFFWKLRSIVQLFLEVEKDCWVVFQVRKELELGFLGRMRCSIIVFYFHSRTLTSGFNLPPPSASCNL